MVRVHEVVSSNLTVPTIFSEGIEKSLDFLTESAHVKETNGVSDGGSIWLRHRQNLQGREQGAR